MVNRREWERSEHGYTEPLRHLHNSPHSLAQKVDDKTRAMCFTERANNNARLCSDKTTSNGKSDYTSVGSPPSKQAHNQNLHGVATCKLLTTVDSQEQNKRIPHRDNNDPPPHARVGNGRRTALLGNTNSGRGACNVPYVFVNVVERVSSLGISSPFVATTCRPICSTRPTGRAERACLPIVPEFVPLPFATPLAPPWVFWSCHHRPRPVGSSPLALRWLGPGGTLALRDPGAALCLRTPLISRHSLPSSARRRLSFSH